MLPYRTFTPGQLYCVSDYQRKRWYEIGTAWEPFPEALYGAGLDGPHATQAYLAGVMARLFGVSLSPDC